MGLPARANADCAAKIVSRARGSWSYRRGQVGFGIIGLIAVFAVIFLMVFKGVTL
jgi:hypothetical protein